MVTILKILHPISACILCGYNTSMTELKLSHLDDAGKARMVDVSVKNDTERLAIAAGEVLLSLETLDLIQRGLMKKGDVLSIAQIAGIMAAKRTAELIPLCHPLMLTHVDVKVEVEKSLPGVMIHASVKTTGKTGVEMEALTAVSVAALTVYDMVKAVERSAIIQNIRLLEKHGGKSGDLILESGE
jgi:cyclic pyranopterin monophosphate synthase